MHPSARLVRSAVALFLLLPAASFGAPAAGGSVRECPSGPLDANRWDETVPFRCLRGAVVLDHGVGVVIPPPGTGVSVSAETASGEQAFQVHTSADGDVRFALVGNEGEGFVATEARRAGNPCRTCPRACDDRTNNPYSFHLPPEATFTWYFNRGSTPDQVTADEAETAFVNAMNKVMASRNQCLMADNVDLDATYGGDTTATADISPDIVCAGAGQRDGFSVVDFGPLAAPAANCSWYMLTNGLDHLVEADIRIRAGDAWTVNPKAPGCKNEWDLQGLLIHERGHTFGLGHVGPKHGNLTMSTWGLPACSTAYRTFGRGDVLGLRSLY